MGARFAAQDLKRKSVYIIHDKTLYGQGVADNFRDEANKLGLKVWAMKAPKSGPTFRRSSRR